MACVWAAALSLVKCARPCGLWPGTRGGGTRRRRSSEDSPQEPQKQVQRESARGGGKWGPRAPPPPTQPGIAEALWAASDFPGMRTRARPRPRWLRCWGPRKPTLRVLPTTSLGKQQARVCGAGGAQDRQTDRQGGCPAFPELPQPGCPTTRPGPLQWSLSFAEVGPVPLSVAVTSRTTHAHPQSQRRLFGSLDG